MSILARFLEIERRLGGGFDVPEPAPQVISADVDPAELLASVQNNPGVVARREQEARLAALNVPPPDDGTPPPGDPIIPPVIDEPTGGGNTTSDESFIENGRILIYRVTRDSSGNIISREFLRDLGPEDTGAGDPPPVTTVPGDPVQQFNAREFAQTNYGFLGEELIEVFLSEYNSNGGDVDESLRAMRGTQIYKDKFPGIFREDGTTLRFSTETPELDYIKMKEDYFNALEDYNLNPTYFEDKVTQLFENDVDPRTFTNRLETAYGSLFNQFDAVKSYYVENYPGTFPSTDDISDEAIFASFISEDISADIIAQRISVSQIGGAFKEEDFAVSAAQAQRLVSAGLSGTGAQQIAQRAEARLPRLQRLARRFTGRDDIFGLSEFIESEVFGEGVAAQVRERLEAEQQTAFSRESGAVQTDVGVTGLVEQ
mgnify:CR=1 FL=1|tara:strand:+ start:1089 stop:2375 length:1287 start_codon:yes stop_codon:yes gene_type:complete